MKRGWIFQKSAVGIVDKVDKYCGYEKMYLYIDEIRVNATLTLKHY